MRRIIARWRQDDLGIRRYLDLARACPKIRDRHASDFPVILRRYDDIERCRKSSIASRNFNAILRKRHFVIVRSGAARLKARGPDSAVFDISQINIRPPRIAGDIFAPTRYGEIAPAAEPRSGGGDHNGVAAVRQKMTTRYPIVRRAEPAQHGWHEFAYLRRLTHFFGAHPFYRDIARRPFLQQKLGRLDDWIGMKARSHRSAVKRVRDSNQTHPWMLRHIGAHDGDTLTLLNTPRRVVQGLIPAVPATPAHVGQTGEIPHRGDWFDHGCERRRIGRDDDILTEPALESEAGDTKIGILIGEIEIAEVVRGLGNPPRNSELSAVFDLAAHDQPGRLMQ